MNNTSIILKNCRIIAAALTNVGRFVIFCGNGLWRGFSKRVEVLKRICFLRLFEFF